MSEWDWLECRPVSKCYVPNGWDETTVELPSHHTEVVRKDVTVFCLPSCAEGRAGVPDETLRWLLKFVFFDM